MSKPDQEPRAQRLIVVERSRLTSVLRIITGLAYAIIVICAFAVNFARQHTIDTLRAQIDTDSALVECRSLLAADITERQQTADNALNELVALVTRQVLSVVPPNRAEFEGVLERLESAQRDADQAIDARTEWINRGSPLPCPTPRTYRLKAD